MVDWTSSHATSDAALVKRDTWERLSSGGVTNLKLTQVPIAMRVGLEVERRLLVSDLTSTLL